MQHFPIFLDLLGRTVVIGGNGAFALAKLRLLLKTEAKLVLFAPQPEADLLAEAVRNGVTLHPRAANVSDLAGAALAYAAHGEAEADARFAALARQAGVLINVVDNLEASAFITPAIVDRAPVTVAIGTEGAAPVLARALKTELEATLPQGLGALARAGKLFRPQAEALPQGRARRDFWADYYFTTGPQVLAEVGEELLGHALRDLLARHLAAAPQSGRVDLVGAGPGDPELMTLRARRLLDSADVVIHDRLIPAEVLELARREATFVAVGDMGFGPTARHETLTAQMIAHARSGAHVVRLKTGDARPSAPHDAETQALAEAGIAWAVTPGLSAAPLKTPLTRPVLVKETA